MKLRHLVAGGLLATSIGCAGNPAPVPIMGDEPTIGHLEGEWTGIYSSRASGRSGSIVFTLVAGSDTAHGDVVMIPAGYDEVLEPVDASLRENDVPHVLRIDFVQAARGTVSGRLEPYRDPGCGCILSTTFEGELEDDQITGTFVTYHSGTGERQTGIWEVRRKVG